MLAQVAGVIVADRLEVDIFRRDPGKGGLGQDGLGHVLDRILCGFVNERDVLVLARSDAGDDFAPSDLGVDDRLATALPLIDHHDEILHEAILPRPKVGCAAEYL